MQNTKVKSKQRGKTKRWTAKEQSLIANFSSGTVEAKKELNNVFQLWGKRVNLKFPLIIRAKVSPVEDVRSYHSQTLSERTAKGYTFRSILVLFQNNGKITDKKGQ